MAKDQVAKKLRSELTDTGYATTSSLDTRSCFDLAAKRGDTSFLVKILENINALSPDAANEIQTAARFLGAHEFLVGERAAHEKLQYGVVYDGIVNVSELPFEVRLSIAPEPR